MLPSTAESVSILDPWLAHHLLEGYPRDHFLLFSDRVVLTDCQQNEDAPLNEFTFSLGLDDMLHSITLAESFIL